MSDHWGSVAKDLHDPSLAEEWTRPPRAPGQGPSNGGESQSPVHRRVSHSHKI